jgi:uncharacterized protein
LRCGPEIFAKERWYSRWKAMYRTEPIAQLFRQTFSESADGSVPALLGSNRLRKLLLIVMRNASTGSPWPVSNNPKARFNDPALTNCNLNVPLWQLLRASTAAPIYFQPEEICLGEEKFLFVDGGMTPFNNPTLIAVLMTTLPAYKIGWTATREELHVISIGTGTAQARLPRKQAANINLLDAMAYLAPAWIGAISAEQDFLCRVLGDCVYGAHIDSEVEALDSPSLLAAEEQKFSYVRYDQEGEQTNVDDLTQADVPLDDLTLIPFLQKLGRTYAAEHVRLEHFFARERSA